MEGAQATGIFGAEYEGGWDMDSAFMDEGLSVRTWLDGIAQDVPGLTEDVWRSFEEDEEVLSPLGQFFVLLPCSSAYGAIATCIGSPLMLPFLVRVYVCARACLCACVRLLTGFSNVCVRPIVICFWERQ